MRFARDFEFDNARPRVDFGDLLVPGIKAEEGGRLIFPQVDLAMRIDSAARVEAARGAEFVGHDEIGRFGANARFCWLIGLAPAKL